MRRVCLIRHGATRANEARLYCGSSDLPLSDRGLAELLHLREGAGYPERAGYSVYTSGMVRTEQTLEALFGPVAHQVEPDLRELDFGVFELHSYEELAERADYQTWISGDNENQRCPGGESGREMTARVWRAFWRLVGAGDALIVTHGGPIAAIMAGLFPGEGKNRFQWQSAPGHGYQIELEADGGGLAPRTYRPIPESRPLDHKKGSD